MNSSKIAHSRHSSQKNEQHAPQKRSAQRSTIQPETGFSRRPQRAITNLAATTPDEVIGLQRLVGNRAVQQLLASRTVQARLTVGPAHDRYELEAERVAQQVISTPNADRSQTAQSVEGEPQVGLPVASSTHAVQQQADDEERLPETESAGAPQIRPLVASITPVAQRQADDEENLQETEAEEALQTGRSEQRQADDEEEEEVQAKGDMHRPEDRFAVGEAFERHLATARRNGQPLPESVRHDMEARFGVDFSQVRIHTDPEADRLSQSIHAQAFTHGADIYFGAGRYDPDTDAGRALLAHELTHVVQQQAGRQSAVAQRLMDYQKFKQITPGKWRFRSKVSKIDALIKQYSNLKGEKDDLTRRKQLLDQIEQECRAYKGNRKSGVNQLLEQVKKEQRFIDPLAEAITNLKANSFEDAMQNLFKGNDEFLEITRNDLEVPMAQWPNFSSLFSEIISVMESDVRETVTRSLIEKDLEKLEKIARDQKTDNLMRNILNEILENKGKIYFQESKGVSPGATLATKKDRDRGIKEKYRVDLMMFHPEGSPERISSLVHEMTHVAVQEKFQNTALHLAFKKETSDGDIKALSDKRTKQLKNLEQCLEKTKQNWTDGQYQLLRGKILYPTDSNRTPERYALSLKEAKKITEEEYNNVVRWIKMGVNNTIIEFDTVINQMMYLMTAWKVDPENEFYKKLREIAEEAYNYRQSP